MIQRIKNWEQWPFKILYAPIVPMWIWYMLKSRSVWFFTPSNPRLTFGGMEGEPKKEMHDLLPLHLCPPYFNVSPQEDFEKVLSKLAKASIEFPLIVKPEIGWQGILLRRIETPAELRVYHEKVPAEYLIQQMVNLPIEVSLFYYRLPHQKKGTVSGFLQKVPLHVQGDGRLTLDELFIAHGKASKRLEELRVRHKPYLAVVLPAGEKYMLSYAANHNRGASFIDLREDIDGRVTALLDPISHENDFFYGRYDIMCNSIEELKEGKNFVILEYNGCGAEPNHFYDTGYTLWGAWREILKHWRMLYLISRQNYKRGVKYWPLLKGLQFMRETKKYYKKIKVADILIP